MTPSCTVRGTDGPDTLTGTPGDDVLCGGNGDDVLLGLGGNDLLVAGTGADRLEGGDGDDTLDGGNDNDALVGGPGRDTLDGGVGHDTLDGGDGDDTLRGGNENDVLRGEAGADLAFGSTGDDEIDGGPGNDVLAGENDHDAVVGGDGDDVLTGATGQDVLDGGAGADALDGGNDADTLLGGPGADALGAGHGADRLDGGAGDDALDGGPDQDVCDGSTGTNTFVACETTQQDPTPETPVDPEADTDGDGVPDALELALGTSPTGADSDGDGLADADEFLTGTDPLTADTDDDGVADGLDDADGDGVADADEIRAGTHPGRSDTDGDGLEDGAETAGGTDPLRVDSDGDSVGDHDEQLVGADPLRTDSDDNGVEDRWDVFHRTVALESSGAEVEVSGAVDAILPVRLAPTEDVRLEEQGLGLLSSPVDLVLPDGAWGTLSIPFDASDVADEDDVMALSLDETTGAFEPTAHWTDLETGQVHVGVRSGGPVPTLARAASAVETCTPLEPPTAWHPTTYVVVDVAEFEAIWQSEMPTPRAKYDNVDVVLTLDSSGSMLDNDPQGARRDAAIAYVDALLAGDRAAVVDFDDWATVVQGLTEDREAVRAAIGTIDDSGGTHLGYAVQAALGELSENGSPAHQRVIVMLTDGEGPYWDTLTERAVETDTLIYTVALGASADTGLLGGIASATGGKSYQVLEPEALSDAFGDISSEVGTALDDDQAIPDADGDGLADQAESSGLRTGTGAVYRTDPAVADTDGDGLPDGAEMGALCDQGQFGASTYYRAVSNPTRVDSDFDGLDDWFEVANVSRAFQRDYDRDGLSDYAELMVHETEPLSNDTDGDGFTDDWEIDAADAGFSPDVVDVRMEWWEYAGDFSRGALCGDADFWAFCESTSLAFVSGAVAAGFVGVGDVRDALAGLAKGDLVSTGLSLAALVPYVGDSASIVTKLVKHLDRVLADVGPALRYVGRADSIPAGLRIKALDEAFDNAATALKGRGLSEENVLAFARRGMSPKHVVAMLDGARDVRRGTGTFTREIDAERLLRDETPAALPGRPGHSSTGAQIDRYLDVTDLANRIGYEVKLGKVHGAGRAGRQVGRDADYLAGGRGPLTEIEWHFFANGRGVVGPDEDLLARMTSLGIPYVIHLP
ncbi:Leukotoxin [Cellulomonas hominis]|nr:VWA domain-containing protein [Cellulomonas hominis]VTR75280.1 Leukotoxin [Cellulomonas hominis]